MFRFIFLPDLLQLHRKRISFISENFETAEEAKRQLDAIARYTLFLHETSLMPDYSNYGYVEQLVDGEWEEIEIEDSE